MTKYYCDLEIVSKMFCLVISFAFLFLPKHGDIKINIEPKTKETRFFTCFHLNVNNILAHIELPLLEANNIHQFDILCASKTHLDSSVAIDETILSHQSKSPVCSGHPRNVKRGGVCLYYKKSLSFSAINVSRLFHCHL